MKRRLTVVLLLLVLIPGALLTVAGLRVRTAEAERGRRRFEELLQLRAAEIDAELARHLREVERELVAVLSLPDRGEESLRRRMREHRLVRQLFVLAADGSLAWPLEAAGGFRERAGALFAEGGVARRPDPEARDAGFGWRPWFWGDGVHWLFWRREADGAVVGAEVDRSALMADILAALPATEPGGTAESRFAVIEAGRVLYQWGGYDPAAGEQPRARRTLSSPLEAWSLEVFATDPLVGAAVTLAPIASLAAVVLALAGLAFYLHREGSRELREAAQRISFVSQVSHELKSPLTNIRLYAELLERRLPPADERAREQLAVVVDESRRLGRLIANVLTFTRRGSAVRPLAPRPGVVDETVAAVLAHFEPAFAAAGFAVEFHRGAAEPALFDADALEQIVGNLLSNAEKYAAAGRYVGIRTGRGGDITTIEVEDRGPGIPREARERVFQPFLRLSNRLTDGVAGTGIGLTIARELARQHGGDLVVGPSAPGEPGARFVLTLRTPPTPPPGEVSS